MASTTEQTSASNESRLTLAESSGLAAKITLDLPLPEPEPLLSAPADPVGDLIEALFASDVYAAQLEQPARKPTNAKIEKAIRALLDGPQSSTALAQRVGDRPDRARSFTAILGQLLNVDGVQVLETLADGRTLRLHVGLLRAQFGLS